jgi:hypothetical protein
MKTSPKGIKFNLSTLIRDHLRFNYFQIDDESSKSNGKRC